MSGGIPREAVPVSVVVLLYSVVCFTLCFLLVCLLISFGERWTYVTIFSAFTAVSTLGSIIQQLHYATAWVVIKEAQFNQAVQSLTHKGLALGGAAQPVDKVLFYIQFYCYNVMSLNILFWTIALFTGSWGITTNWLGNWHDHVPVISKVFSILFPALIVGLINVQAVIDSAAAVIVASYISMFTSLSMGGILLVLILYKYVKTRRLVAGYSRRGRWWASGSKDSRATRDFSQQATVESGVTSNTRRSIYDRALLVRFSIGFVILAIFEVAIIVFTLFQSNNNAQIAASGGPDFSVSNTISDIVLFIPGVTASLVAFLVFGTTKSWRQYCDLVVGGCGIKRKFIEKKVQRNVEGSRSQGLEFQRLDSLPRRESEEIRRKDAEDRVRMFVKETGPRDRDDSISPVESSEPSTRTRGESVGRQSVQFHRPLPQARTASKQPPAGVIEVSFSVKQEDQVIQYERDEGNQQGHARQISAEPRRFVMERLPQQTQTDFLESASE